MPSVSLAIRSFQPVSRIDHGANYSRSNRFSLLVAGWIDKALPGAGGVITGVLFAVMAVRTLA
jgi:hypothetical protein